LHRHTFLAPEFRGAVGTSAESLGLTVGPPGP
jgi:hypothetical protein